MAVGTIPILNYAEYVYPRLVDGDTCLTFQTLEELVAKVRDALDMDERHLEAMHAKVLDLYRSQLTPEAFGRRLIESSSVNRSLYVCSSNLSV
jgi:hypothetical protein